MCRKYRMFCGPGHQPANKHRNDNFTGIYHFYHLTTETGMLLYGCKVALDDYAILQKGVFGLRNTKSKVVIGKKEVFANGRVYDKEVYKRNQEYRVNWNRQKNKQIQVRLRKDKYPDVINWLSMQTNFNEYVRELMKADMERLEKEGKIKIDKDTGAVTVLCDPAEIGCDVDFFNEYTYSDDQNEPEEQ